MATMDRGRAAVAALSLVALIGCSADPSNPASSSPSADASAAQSAPGSSTAGASASEQPASIAELVPGSYANVVTNDLVLRSEPGTSAESEMYPDRLNAPTSVYIAHGPIEADGYAWYYVAAFGDDGTEPALIGWAAAGGKDGEVWLEPIAHGNDAWSLLETGEAPPDLNPRSSAMGPDGQIYFFGELGSSDEPTGRTWAFDPASGLWRELAPMPTPRSKSVVAATQDGLFYVIGGSPGGPISSDDTSVVEVYDAETNRWTRTNNAPLGPSTAGDGKAIAGSDGVIRVFAYGDVVRYDPSTSSWESESSRNATLWDVAITPDSSLRVLEYGGGVHAYDPADGTLDEGIEVPGITRYGAALAAASDGRLLVLGGTIEPGLGATCTGFRGAARVSLVEALDPSTGEWTTMAPLPVPLYQPAAFATATGVLVVGLGDRAAPGDPASLELVVAELSLGPSTADADLIATDQETSPSGCGA